MAGDAERFGGLLAAAVGVGLPDPAEDQGGGDAQREQQDQHVAPGEMPQGSLACRGLGLDIREVKLLCSSKSVTVNSR
jgi:hypothetical protein